MIFNKDKQVSLLLLFSLLSGASNTFAEKATCNEVLVKEEIEKYEGYSSVPYRDVNGKPTIGFGHQLLMHEDYIKITKTIAVEMLAKDIKRIEEFIHNSVTVPLTKGQVSALVSLIYNWGYGNFYNSHGLSCLNSGDYEVAAAEFFSKEKGVVYIKGHFSKQLYDRRRAELDLWSN